MVTNGRFQYNDIYEKSQGVFNRQIVSIPFIIVFMIEEKIDFGTSTKGCKIKETKHTRRNC